MNECELNNKMGLVTWVEEIRIKLGNPKIPDMARQNL